MHKIFEFGLFSNGGLAAANGWVESVQAAGISDGRALSKLEGVVQHVNVFFFSYGSEAATFKSCEVTTSLDVSQSFQAFGLRDLPLIS